MWFRQRVTRLSVTFKRVHIIGVIFVLTCMYYIVEVLVFVGVLLWWGYGWSGGGGGGAQVMAKVKCFNYA